MERASQLRGRGHLFDRRAEQVTVGSLVALALALMLLSDSYQARVARHVEDFTLGPFRAVDRWFTRLGELHAERGRLGEELAAAKLDLARTEEVRLENDRLRQMLGFEAREPLDLIGCEVVGEGAGRLGGATVLLNRGYNQGIREGMAIAGKDGLAGKIVEVRPDRAQALLLIHPDCAVSVRVERSRVAGIAEWSPGSLTTLKLRNISYLADVKVGDRVITSGLGGVYPEGIPVGSVTAVKRDETGLLLDIDVKSAIDFRSLEEIFALRPPGMSAERSTAGGPVSAPELGREPVVPFRRAPLPHPDPGQPQTP
jgi:rod shape-determining protein MreC